ncbi:MAG: response regulator [Candidatus Sulfomarinibacteraceae bacterium]
MFKIPIDILIVDDEPDFVEMLALRLEDAGHRVRTAQDGDAGLAALDEGACDVVILDIRMPGKDGITVLKAIKNDHPLVEVILLTGHGTVDTAVEGLKTGAFDYIQKPARFDELLEKLEDARDHKAEHEKRVRRAEARALMRQSGDV